MVDSRPYLKRHYGLSKKDVVFIVLMIALPLAHFAVFSVYININSLVLAFRKLDFETNREVFAGFENFARFFNDFKGDSDWPRAILNSVLYFPVCVLLMLPLSVVAGYFLYRKIAGHSAFKIIFFLPSIISIVVLGIVFRSMFNSSYGPVNWFLINVFGVEKASIPGWLIDQRTAMPILYLYAIWAGIGYNVVLLFGAMTRVPLEIVESARLDGISTTREIFQIFVPIIWPTLSTLTVFGAMTIFQQYLHPMVLTQGSGRTYTIAYLIITHVNNGQYYYAAALGILCMLVALPVVQLTKWAANKMHDVVEV